MTVPTLEEAVPGDPAGIRRLAARLDETGRAAANISSELAALHDASGTIGWRGRAADTFRQEVSSVSPRVASLAAALRGAGHALTSFAARLEHLRGDAQHHLQALAEAERAVQHHEVERQHADGDVARLTARVVALRSQEAALAATAAIDPAVAAQRDRVTAARRAVESDLNAARRRSDHHRSERDRARHDGSRARARLDDLEHDRRQTVERCADEIEEHFPQSWWDRIREFFDEVVRAPVTRLGHEAGAVVLAPLVEGLEHLVVPVAGHMRDGRWIAPHVRWHPGTAGTMNKVLSARTAARFASWAKIAVGVDALIGGYDQYVEDDAGGFSGSERWTRAAAGGAAVAVTGFAAGKAGALGGAWAGGQIGLALGGPAGAAVGAAVGGVVGAVAASGATSLVADQISDRGAELGSALHDAWEWGSSVAADAGRTLSEVGDGAKKLFDSITPW